MSERKGAIILLWIVAFGSLGFSGYLFVKNEIFSAPSPDSGVTSPDSGLTLVGLWDDLAKNKEFAPYTTDYNWLIEFDNNQFNISNYFEVSNNNTRFKLLKEGFYKITLLLRLDEATADEVYWAYLIRNGAFDHCLARIAISENPGSLDHQIESSVYVKSTGLDNFSIRCYSTGSAEFKISHLQTFNQLSIEYNN